MIRTSDIRKLSDFPPERDGSSRPSFQKWTSGNLDSQWPKGVVMAPRVFDAMTSRLEELETTSSIRRGLADVAAGRTRPARKAKEQLAADLNLDLTEGGES